ncbi:Possible 2,5-didehydrogluconate reductase [Propionibacterium freudenreichii subsp. freudenreichii]|uniref:Possible 2,5-didehydrogluconate reductase n=1 Tax=Propionibacterium freudenreichii subsp. freudenreichii TaxID=66712 RepID=A0A0B7NUQ3_PROFF|nr:Possible 2,5-didehydrogluconate reductase [Propionibacterium freudenreichii subsp. freudenreichii]
MYTMESANEMEHTMRHLQISGVSVPAIGIGTWHMGCSPARFDAECDALRAGIDAGARVIDTAEMYGSGASESMVGTAIKGLDRSELFIITKVLPNNASRKQMEHSLDASLARLGTDYADLYLLHWRGEVPLEQTVEEMQRLWHSGKIKSWGVSNFDLADMEELAALPHGNHVAANEDLYNLSSRGIEFELIGWQRSLDIPLIAYSPLGASGGERGAGDAHEPGREQGGRGPWGDAVAGAAGLGDPQRPHPGDPADLERGSHARQHRRRQPHADRRRPDAARSGVPAAPPQGAARHPVIPAEPAHDIGAGVRLLPGNRRHQRAQALGTLRGAQVAACRQPIRQQLVTIARHHRFRMELHRLHGQLAMPQRHDHLVVERSGGHVEHIGH